MSTPAPADTSILAWSLLTLLVGGPLVWIAWQYVKAARAPRRDEPQDRMNWLRASYPNHPALPAPARQAPWMPTARRWSGGRLVIYAVQASVIAYLAWIMLGGAEPGGITPDGWQGLGVMLWVAVIIVAFATAVLTNLWAWAYGQLQGLPFRVGRGVRALRHAVTPQRAIQSHYGEPGGASGSRWLGREAPEGRPHLGIRE